MSDEYINFNYLNVNKSPGTAWGWGLSLFRMTLKTDATSLKIK